MCYLPIVLCPTIWGRGDDRIVHLIYDPNDVGQQCRFKCLSSLFNPSSTSFWDDHRGLPAHDYKWMDKDSFPPADGKAPRVLWSVDGDGTIESQTNFHVCHNPQYSPEKRRVYALRESDLEKEASSASGISDITTEKQRSGLEKIIGCPAKCGFCELYWCELCAKSEKRQMQYWVRLKDVPPEQRWRIESWNQTSKSFFGLSEDKDEELNRLLVARNPLVQKKHALHNAMHAIASFVSQAGL